MTKQRQLTKRERKALKRKQQGPNAMVQRSLNQGREHLIDGYLYRGRTGFGNFLPLVRVWNPTTD